jgi:exopolysaccharide production protein ExoF
VGKKTAVLCVLGAALCILCAGRLPAAAPDNYKINVGDELEFDILDDEDPPQLFTVGRDGMVQLPFIGGMPVEAVSVGDARELIRRTYVEREIFVSPAVELSIASFRPIFVLGDVRDPGNYDFQPFLTAEQAVGLAGGAAISANNEEARILERRNLEGTLSSLEYDLALLAAQYARVKARLNGEDSVSWANVPPDVRPGVNRELFDEHKVNEDQIILLEVRDSAQRRQLLAEAVAEAEERITLLDQREGVLSQALEVTKGELERIKDLVERELVPKADVNVRILAVKRAEDVLLEMREQRSAARVQLAGLRGQLSQFDAEREKTLVSESQRYWSEIKKLVSNRQSLEDRLGLLQQWVNAARGLETALLIEFQVRRREGEGVQNLILQPFDELVPGDLLVVVVKPPESLRDQE